MIKDILSIRGAKVLDFETGECLALLNLPIIHPDTGVIEAFWVKPLHLMMQDGIILTSDILEFKKHVYIRSENKISNPSEVIRIRDILDDGRQFLNVKAQNEKGKKFGWIYNLTFSTETYVLRQLYCGKRFLGIFFFGHRIFPYERVLKVIPHAVIVDDETEKKEKFPEIPAEPA